MSLTGATSKKPTVSLAADGTGAAMQPGSPSKTRAAALPKHLRRHSPTPTSTEEVHPVSAVLSPKETYEYMLKQAHIKDAYSLPKSVLLGVSSGMYVGLGYSTMVCIGGSLSADFRHGQPGAFAALYAVIGFPCALVLIVLTGGDLFTSTSGLYAPIGYLEGQFSLLRALSLCLISYCSNLAGCLLMVGLMVAAQTYHGKEAFMIEIVEHKLTLGWGVILIRAVLANLLVCLATWLANSSRDLVGKIAGVYLPIMAFVAMSFEHCIANMFVVPMGLIAGADFSVAYWICHSQIPATIGNVIGGACLMGCMYACVYGTPGHAITVAWNTWTDRLTLWLLAWLPTWRRSSTTLTAAAGPGAAEAGMTCSKGPSAYAAGLEV